MWRVQYGNQYDILGYVYARTRAAQLENLRSVPTNNHGGTMDPLYQWFLTVAFSSTTELTCNGKTPYIRLLPTIQCNFSFLEEFTFQPRSIILEQIFLLPYLFRRIYSSIDFRRVRNLLELTLLFPRHYTFLSPSSENNNDIQNKFSPNLKSVIRRKSRRVHA